MFHVSSFLPFYLFTFKRVRPLAGRTLLVLSHAVVVAATAVTTGVAAAAGVATAAIRGIRGIRGIRVRWTTVTGIGTTTSACSAGVVLAQEGVDGDLGAQHLLDLVVLLFFISFTK